MMDFAVKTVEQLRNHLRSLRKASGLTQKQLGVRLGLGQVRIAEIESNPGSVSTEQLLQVLHALNAELAIKPKLESLTIPSRFAYLRQPIATQLGDKHADATRDTFSAVMADIAQNRLTGIMSLSDSQSHAVVEALTRPRQTEALKTHAGRQGDSAAAPRPVMVSARDADELEFWANSFGVATQELLDAIKAVGVKAIVQTDAHPNKGAW